ncbi:MAG: tetratricopeptide repeat protein [Gemmatimonadetes bacterium]|nr:tetratricopeptide repeat protein [Gemmatimonadota bacterium]
MRHIWLLLNFVGLVTGTAQPSANQASADLSVSRRLAAAQGAARIPLLANLAEQRREEADTVLAITNEALLLLATHPSVEWEARIRASRSHALEVKGNFPDALAEAQRAEAVARPSGRAASLGAAMYQTATVEWRMARYDSALVHAERARNLLATGGATDTWIRAVSLVGAIHHAMGDLERGLQGYLAALRISDSLGNEIAAARSHNNIGLIYLDLERTAEGLDALRRALAIHERLGPQSNLANTLNNIGLALLEEERPAEALPYLTRVLAMDREAGNPYGEAKELINIGGAYEDLGQPARALDYFTQSLALREQIGDKDGMVRSIGAIAKVRMRTGDPRSAIPLFERSIALAGEIQNRIDEAEQLGLLAQAKAAAGDSAGAYATFRLFHERQQALLDSASHQRIAEMEAQYRTRERERDLTQVRQLAESRRRWLISLSIASALLAGSLMLVGVLHATKRRARRAHAESEARYRTLFQSSTIPTLLVDRERRTVIDLNGPTRSLLDLAADVRALPLADIAAEPIRLALARLLDAPRDGSMAFDDRWTDATGQTCWTEVRGSEVALDGRTSLLVTVRDTSDRHRQDEAREREDRIQSLGVLAGGIAHDFNNALMAILGNVSLARNAADEQRNELLGQAELATLGASRLTRQLLTFARGGQPVRRATSIAQLLPGAVALAEAGVKAAVDLKIPEGLWAASVDAGQFSQVIANLVLNAIEATDGRGHVRVRASNHAGTLEPEGASDSAQFVRIDVEDDGPGIPDTVLHRVFDPYFTTKAGGNGLGLATAYSICRQHGGTLRVTSREGAGTTFSAWFPAGVDWAVVAPPAPSEQPDGAGTILVLDDEPMVRRVLQRMLADWGYAVQECSDGAEAVSRYAERLSQGMPFDLLIMDLTIPGGMGGRQAMAEILAIDPNARAIVASGYADDPTMSAFRDAGFQAALAKPFQREDLGRAITAVLGESAVRKG